MEVRVVYPAVTDELIEAELPFMVECNQSGSVFYVFKADTTFQLYSVCLIAKNVQTFKHVKGNEYQGLYRAHSVYSLFKGTISLKNKIKEKHI